MHMLLGSERWEMDVSPIPFMAETLDDVKSRWRGRAKLICSGGGVGGGRLGTNLVLFGGVEGCSRPARWVGWGSREDGVRWWDPRIS
jgi:hypothetical protein